MTRAIGLQVCLHEMDVPRIVSREKKGSSVVYDRPVSAATIG